MIAQYSVVHPVALGSQVSLIMRIRCYLDSGRSDEREHTSNGPGSAEAYNPQQNGGHEGRHGDTGSGANCADG